LLLGRDPRFIIPQAIADAEQDLMAPASDLIGWSLPSLTDAFGYLLRGTVTYVAGFPKGGKTGFLQNQLAHWDAECTRVWVMPTESRPKGLMARLACFRAGVSVDDAMSGRLRVRADAGDNDAKRDLQTLFDHFSAMSLEDKLDGSNIAIEPAPRLTRGVFNQSCWAAASAGYRLVVVDHVDHVKADEGSGESGYAASEAVQYDALEFAERYNIAVLLMTQLNTSRVTNDPLYRYKRPIPDWLWMKGVKDQIATSMMGVYRPMLPDIDDKLLQAAKSGQVESWKVAMPNTMGVVDMLSRYNGGTPDRAVLVNFIDGRMTDKTMADAWEYGGDTHGIHTGSPSNRERRVW
jgi:KaiC/GvpD/RAD55 family RecA-like ATPase